MAQIPPDLRWPFLWWALPVDKIQQGDKRALSMGGGAGNGGAGTPSSTEDTRICRSVKVTRSATCSCQRVCVLSCRPWTWWRRRCAWKTAASRCCPGTTRRTAAWTSCPRTAACPSSSPSTGRVATTSMLRSWTCVTGRPPQGNGKPLLTGGPLAEASPSAPQPLCVLVSLRPKPPSPQSAFQIPRVSASANALGLSETTGGEVLLHETCPRYSPSTSIFNPTAGERETAIKSLRQWSGVIRFAALFSSPVLLI